MADLRSPTSLHMATFLFFASWFNRAVISYLERAPKLNSATVKHLVGVAISATYAVISLATIACSNEIFVPSANDVTM